MGNGISLERELRNFLEFIYKKFGFVFYDRRKEDVMDTLIRLQDIEKSFPKTKALAGVNLHLREGDIYGLIGSNGAGKSTLLKVISGAVIPEKGKIEFFGRSGKEIHELRSAMGFLIEEPLLLPNLTGEQNIRYFSKLRGISPDSGFAIAKDFDLDKNLKKKTKNYSTGLKKRLGLVIAMMSRPKVLILDEPINGLDPEGIIYLRNYLLQLNRDWQTTIILSSHILNELAMTANRFGFLKSGKMMEELSKEELNEKNSQYISITFSDDDLKKAVALLEEQYHLSNYKIYPNEELRIYEDLDTKSIQKFLVEHELYLRSIEQKGTSLEDYYLEVMREANHE